MGIKKHIPNSITCMNLISGGIACVMASRQEFYLAALFIYLAAVFDFFDGMSARLLHVSSEIGKELDSLADDISFGLAPGMILYVWLSSNASCADSGCWVPFLCFIISAFAAVRLAKFNLDTRQTSSFIGLPTPAMSILTASTIALLDSRSDCNFELLRSLASNPVVVLAYVALMSWLMVCELPMFSLKFKNLKWQGNEAKFILIGCSVILLAALQLTAIPLIIVLFILMSVVLWLKNK